MEAKNLYQALQMFRLHHSELSGRAVVASSQISTLVHVFELD